MYTAITIIFNPNSTGDAPEKAKELAESLKKSLPTTTVALQETQRAGHAEELAYAAATKGREPLVISVSGDGGYNEVVNGVMRAVDEGHTPICTVLAAGNANDHRRLVRKRPLVEAIAAHDISSLDLLEATWGKRRRFAHSYVGLGLTPVVAVELNKNTLNALKELVLVVKTYWQYRPLKINIRGKMLRIDSLVLSNISGMAKVLKFDETSTPTDGKFEVSLVPHRHKLSSILWALKAATVGLSEQPQAEKMEFTALEKMPMQLDGEVVEVAANATVAIRIAHKKLNIVR